MRWVRGSRFGGREAELPEQVRSQAELGNEEVVALDYLAWFAAAGRKVLQLVTLTQDDREERISTVVLSLRSAAPRRHFLKIGPIFVPGEEQIA